MDSSRYGAAGSVPSRREVSVLLATFNGERYVAELLNSLLAQTYADFLVIVSDGGSTDLTNRIVHQYAAASPDRFLLLPQPPTRLDATRNFARLLDAADSEYVLFCDQDDIWLPHKISISLERMKALEAEQGKTMPLLAHTGLIVVDRDLREIDDPRDRRLWFSEGANAVLALAITNFVTGCTVVANRALYSVARPVPADAIMHDHWLAAVAAALGRLSYIPAPTLLYRQHDANALGIGQAGGGFFAAVAHTLFRQAPVVMAYSRSCRVFVQRYGHALRGDLGATLAAFGDLPRRPLREKARILRAIGYSGPGFVRRLALWTVVLHLSCRYRS